MDKEKLAEILDGSEYPFGLPSGVIEPMIGADLVVVYGLSDDIMRFEGAINEEVGVFDGGGAYLTKTGLLENKCEDECCPHFQKELESAVEIKAIWCETPDISWSYKIDIPHATFRVFEDEEVYCIGIVFNLSEAKP